MPLVVPPVSSAIITPKWQNIQSSAYRFVNVYDDKHETKQYQLSGQTSDWQKSPFKGYFNKKKRMSGYQKPQKYKKKMSQKILKSQFFLPGNTNNKKDSNNNLRIVQINVEDIMK